MGPIYQRVVVKLSGEALMGNREYGLDDAVMSNISNQIGQVVAQGIQVAVVIGGGNIWRGTLAAQRGMERTTADYAGMLATVINALTLQDALEKAGLATRTQTALEIRAVAEPFIRRRAVRHLEKGRVVIFAGGTGNPYMTTDTAAALRAIEIGAGALLMAKNKVDGIYDADPLTNPGARKFSQITHQDAIHLHLRVMDATALALCRENNLPIIVFDLQAQNSIERAVAGEPLGTLVTS
ncbi:MAG: UMP kinase [Dehalococcoidia bacterium]|jgi:uridylate kinase|nr:UMP kinase [Dehalococcoidia bacterium]MDP7240904.1 UMP kinase [Dehalococcoidia bacterium]